MIASVTSGSSFGGLQSYLFKERGNDAGPALEDGLQDYLISDGERVLWTEGRNMSGDDQPAEWAAPIMRATASQNLRVEKPVYHLSLSASPGEELSREEWSDVADRVLRRLGLQKHQALVVAHGDTRHRHVHLMVNRVHPETLRAWDRWQDYPKIERELRHIERDLKLREVPGHHYRLPGQERPGREPGPTPGETRQTARTGKLSWGESIRFRVYDDMKRAESWGDLERRLSRHGLCLRRRGGGLVVTDGRQQVKASRIYRRGSYAHLKRRFGMSFETWRHGKAELLAKVADVRDGERLVAQRQRATATISKAQSVINQRTQLRDHSSRNARAISDALARLYREKDLPQVRRRLVASARRIGWEKTAARVAASPREFGKLQPNLPPVTQTLRIRHRQMKSARRYLPQLLRNQAALRATRATVGPAAYRAMGALLRGRQVVREANRLLHRRPSSKTSLLEIGSRAAKLCVSALSLVVAPGPMKVIQLGMRSVELARSASRSLGRGR